jgi:hypothetical protein
MTPYLSCRGHSSHNSNGSEVQYFEIFTTNSSRLIGFSISSMTHLRALFHATSQSVGVANRRPPMPHQASNRRPMRRFVISTLLPLANCSLDVPSRIGASFTALAPHALRKKLVLPTRAVASAIPNRGRNLL